jgi:hypothetical protein
LTEELFDMLSVFFGSHMFLMSADNYFDIRESFFKCLLILFLERAKGLHAVSEVDSINLELRQRPYPLQQFVRACQSRTAGAIDYAYQRQFLIFGVFGKGPLSFPEISETGHGRTPQILRCV